MIEELNNICKTINNVDLKKYNTFKLESSALIMVFPSTVDELKKVLDVSNKYNKKYFVLGNGSNVILPSFYDGIIIKLSNFNKYELKDNTVYAESGCMLNKLASEISSKGYAGLDFATGIPGSVGGSIYGNAGCFGSSISEILISAEVFDGEKIVTLTNKDFKFGYRTSMLKENANKNYIILSALFKVEESDKETLKALIKERTEKRFASQDLSHPSNGSMFRNPENNSAGALIDNAGLKGLSVGDAMVSYKHANFIINNNNAKQEDVIKLVEIIKDKIKEKYDVDLVLEQEIIK